MAALNITICPNGNQYVRKKLVLNRKRIPKFEVLLDNATQILGTRDCVRQLRTPNNGTRVFDLDSMVNGGVYVAITRPSDKLIKIQYAGRGVKQPKPPDKPGNKQYMLQRKMMMKVQARAFQEALAEASKHKNIFVYCNGEDRGMKIHLDKRVLISKDKVLQYISDKIQLRTGAVRSIHRLDGREVRDIKGIENNETYVAVGYGQWFQKIGYTEQNISGLTPRRPAQSKLSNSINSSSIKSDKETKHKKSKRTSDKQSLNDSLKITTNKQKQGNMNGNDISGGNGGGDDLGEIKEDVPWFSHLKQKVNNEVDNANDDLTNGLSRTLTLNGDIDTDVGSDNKNYYELVNENDGNIIGDNGVINGNKLNETFQRQGTFEKQNSFDGRSTPEHHTQNILDILNNNDNDDENNNNIVAESVYSPVQRIKKKSKNKKFKSSFDKALLKSGNTDNGDKIEHNYDADNIGNDYDANKVEHSNGGDDDENENDGNKIKKEKKDSVKRDKGRPSKNSSVKKSSKSTKKSRKVDKPATTDNAEMVVPDELKPNLALDEEKVNNHVVNDMKSDDDLKHVSGTPTPPPLQTTLDLQEVVQTQTTKKNDSKSEDSGTDRKSASPKIFEASGEQSEKAEQVRENKETKVEKTIDMLPAEEVEEEMEEQEKTEEKDN